MKSVERPAPETQLFLTKAWGFCPEAYPIFGFPKVGARSNFLREANRGDWIVIAGTKGEPTQPHEQGRLLGMVQVGHEKVDANSILKALGTPLAPFELNKDGTYKWPWSMPVLRAFRFDPQPDTAEILGSYLPGQDWAVYALNVEGMLGTEAKDRILALPTVACEIADLPDLVKNRAYADALTLGRGGGPSGPPPSGTRGGSERELGIGYAYAFRLRGGQVGNAIKIGSTHSPDDRLAQLNREIRPTLTGCEWVTLLQQAFPTERLAYNFEQLVLMHFKKKLIPGEREVIGVSKADLDKAWVDLFVGKEWAKDEAPSDDDDHAGRVDQHGPLADQQF